MNTTASPAIDNGATCTVCGWRYRAERGLPDQGIAAGTPWSEAAAQVMCPACGVGAEDFVAQANPAQAAATLS